MRGTSRPVHEIQDNDTGEHQLRIRAMRRATGRQILRAAAVIALTLLPTSRAWSVDPGLACDLAIGPAERRWGIPPGLLAAMGRVESGHDDGFGVPHPWPWAVDVEGHGTLYDNLPQAVAAVQSAQAAGRYSIDVGCLQINLQQHPQAFTSIMRAFDPEANVEYAARFLVSLRAKSGDWLTAAGMYHSQTPSLATDYRAHVMLAFAAGPSLPVLPGRTSADWPLPHPTLAARTLPPVTLPPVVLPPIRLAPVALAPIRVRAINTVMDGFARTEQARIIRLRSAHAGQNLAGG